ncbi:hypothetical protein L1987_35804 [Smallanthus sonchifolius]|uniref:Uncharacterized protein n=1 Tax=Smallanthus sonchifolius TaxID=185202 RepID=A0ACB9HBT8_9ASTR|nr:hypothetical protein L1987_35804 [Smallanthus sonchifolius]
MKSICLLSSFLFFVVVIFLTTISASYVGNKTDHLALLSFKLMITKDPYGALTSWNSSFHFCDWNGVTCGKRHRRVTVVQLESQGLEGPLSPHVGNLSFLHELWLFNNSFEGTIPHEIGRLFRLRFLGLDKNKFNGIIPTNLSGCSNLEELYLSGNKLVGSIPKEIAFISQLTLIAIHDNNLRGGIPSSLGNITSMEVFSATGNPLGGNIPNTLGNWKSLRELYFGDCNLYGTIPHSIYNLSLVTMFSLDNNKLTGSIPAELGIMQPHLTVLQLRDNQVAGLLPPSISNCSKLQVLELQNNNFSGKVTVDFSKLRDIVWISLYQNNLNGEIKFIDSLKNCSNLKELDLSGCKFQGVVPASIGNLSFQLKHLNLGENQLHGNLPSSIGNLLGLRLLNLESNQFTGEISSTIGMLQNLGVAYLDENQLSGKIPDAIGNLSTLIKLSLSSNRLEGDIPPSLGNCHNLLTLYLYNNKLSGKIPKELLQLTTLSIKFDLSQNNLVGSLPIEVGDLKMLSYMDLSHNNLSGKIPDSLGGSTSLSFLYIKNNSFQGIIPLSLSSLRGLVELDLSHNNFSGQIPRFLEQFLLTYLDLSYNDFEGEVPVLGVFINASAFWVLGNNRLCGGLVELGLPKCKETGKHKKRLHWFIIVILIVSAIFSILCFVYACFKKKSNRQLYQSSTHGRFSKISYNQLLKATDGFSEAMLIGKGGFSSVYKGIIDQDDKTVAIKVLHLQNRGADRSFIAECEVWRSIRHRNLLKIITSCSSVDFHGNDFKALVYEFMPNGSLHDKLHSSACTPRPNLLQRINILINVACALDYLHNHCLSTIVHGDLKPSNILLDDDMVAHVGDFGLARFLGPSLNQNNSIGIRGTIEYAFGSEMTTSGDVFSFGILLLEVMTGKRPTDDIFMEGLSLHKFVYMALEDHVTHAIDEELLKYHHKDEIAMENIALTLKIGVSCSLYSPPHRMNIKNVVNELQHILDMIQNI